MVRCCWRPPNPAVPRHDLRKVRVHVQRSRNGGGGRGPGDQPPRLEGPGPGGLSRSARFRYRGGGVGWWPSVCVAPKLLLPTPLRGSASGIGPWASAVSRAGGGSERRSSDLSGFACPQHPPNLLKTAGRGGRENECSESREQWRCGTFIANHQTGPSHRLSSPYFPLLSVLAEMPLCSLVCSASGGRGPCFSESAQARMGALDYPVECILFADEETEAWDIPRAGGSVVS